MSIFGGLFGKSQQRDMTSAYNDSQSRLDASRGTARADITGGRDRGLSYLTPYVQGGQRGQTAYENTLGLNGQDARNCEWQQQGMRSRRFGAAGGALRRARQWCAVRGTTQPMTETKSSR